MANNYFHFKSFTIQQDRSPFKVGTDGVLLGAWVNCHEVQRTLDIGTGTGLLALMMAQRCETFVDAVEIHQPAFEQAVENIRKSSWPDRCKVHLCPVQSFCQEFKGEKYDLIISNPPFFTRSLKNRDADLSMARHNEHLNFRDILNTSQQLLKPEGKLAVVYPFQDAENFKEVASDYQLYVKRELWVKPTARKNANRLLMELSRISGKISREELIIRDADTKDFTREYKALTREFYLNF